MTDYGLDSTTMLVLVKQCRQLNDIGAPYSMQDTILLAALLLETIVDKAVYNSQAAQDLLRVAQRKLELARGTKEMALPEEVVKQLEEILLFLTHPRPTIARWGLWNHSLGRYNSHERWFTKEEADVALLQLIPLAERRHISPHEDMTIVDWDNRANGD